jgi:hypothetical protein
MIKIQIVDEKNERHLIEARGMLGAALVGISTDKYKASTFLNFGQITESDKLSLISAQLSILAIELIRKGIPVDKVADLFSMMVTDSLTSLFKQDAMHEEYEKERGK